MMAWFGLELASSDFDITAPTSRLKLPCGQILWTNYGNFSVVLSLTSLKTSVCLNMPVVLNNVNEISTS